jgi:hypothetical protein
MSVSIHFPDEIEHALRRRASEAGQDIATFVTSVVTEKLEREAARPQRRRSHEAFKKRLESWISLHPPSTHFVDDSRESIYEGRGE